MNPDVKHEQAKSHKQESATPEGTERIQDRRVYVPQVDILESPQALLLVADMAGVDENGVDVTVEKNILTIKGAVVAEVPAGYKLSFDEYGIGDYERSFTLPNEIDREGIQATIKDGVLKLTLPKAKQALSKKVAVVAG